MVRFNLEEKGYSRDEVDRYVGVLEKKLREYRSMEETIQNAIINAQSYADSLRREAEIDASMIKNEMSSQLNDISESVETIRLRSYDFIKDYENLVKNYLFPMNNEEIELLASRFEKLDGLLESYRDGSLKENEDKEDKDDDDFIEKSFVDSDKELEEQASPIYLQKEIPKEEISNEEIDIAREKDLELYDPEVSRAKEQVESNLQKIHENRDFAASIKDEEFDAEKQELLEKEQRKLQERMDSNQIKLEDDKKDKSEYENFTAEKKDNVNQQSMKNFMSNFFSGK